jgi:hypothetical protein
VTSPKPTDTRSRADRGGGWFDHDAAWVRAAIRITLAPLERGDYIGFRTTQTGCRQQVLKVTP